MTQIYTDDSVACPIFPCHPEGEPGSTGKSFFICVHRRNLRINCFFQVETSIVSYLSARESFFLTWNCRHIANLVIQARIAAHLESIGLLLPFICTPEELLGEEDGWLNYY